MERLAVVANPNFTMAFKGLINPIFWSSTDAGVTLFEWSLLGT